MYAGRTKIVKEFNPESGRFADTLAPRVVEFYSPHCPACVAFSSHYIKMAENTKKLNPEIQFFGVSCDTFEHVCDQYGVQGYPTLRFFKEDEGPASLGIEVEFEQEDAEDESTSRKIVDLLSVNFVVATEKEEQEDRETENTAKYEKDGNTSTLKSKEVLKQMKPKNFNRNNNNQYNDDNNIHHEYDRNKHGDGDSSNDRNEETFENSIKYSQLYKAMKEKYSQERRGIGKYFQNDEIENKQGRPLKHASYDEMTKGMKQNTPGTIEFSNRKQAFQKRIVKSRTNEKLHGTTQELKKDSLPYTKDTTKPKWYKIKMNEEEELILDATLSLTVALETGLSMGITDITSKTAMQDWLNLLSVSLPPEWNIHKFIDHLRNNFEYATKSTQNFKEIMSRHRLARKGWSVSCQNKVLKSEGFSCGFWKLLHVITLGVAEQRGGQNLIDSGMVIPTTVVFSPSNAADTIRNYIDKFFNCRPCREHFLATYYDCNNNRRCERLTSDKNSENPSDWKELSLWLWEVHNDISVRLVRERISSTYTKGVKNTPTLKDEISALFPNINNCFVCFDNNGMWNKAEVFRFLERTYWPDSEKDPMTDKLLVFDNERRSGVGFLCLAVFLVVWLVHKLTGKQSYTIHQSLIAARLIVSQGGVSKSRTV